MQRRMWVVAGWLCGIIGSVLLRQPHYDVALHDFGLMLAPVVGGGALATGGAEDVLAILDGGRRRAPLP